MPSSGLCGHQVCMWYTCIHWAKNTKTNKQKTYTPKIKINTSLKALLFSCLNLTSKAALTLITETCVVNDKAMLKQWALTQNIPPKQVPLLLCRVKHCTFSTINSVVRKHIASWVLKMIFWSSTQHWDLDEQRELKVMTSSIYLPLESLGYFWKKKNHKTLPHDVDAFILLLSGLWIFLLLAKRKDILNTRDKYKFSYPN